MPILPAEPCRFPDTLFTEESPETCVRTWWVLHTMPRQEKCLARSLHQWGVPFYLPLMGKTSLSKGRKRTAQIPLFTSYVFLLGTEEERVRALTTNIILRALPVSDQHCLWHDLKQIYLLIASGKPLQAEQQLQRGVRVQIEKGPLAGLEGTILRSATGQRFVVQVDFIQQGASVEVEDFMLSPVEA